MRAFLTVLVLLTAVVHPARAQDDIAATATPTYIHYTPVEVNVEPTDLHRFIYEAMALCSGLPLRDFDGLVWNTAAWLTDSFGRPVAAYWIDLPDGRRSVWIRKRLWNNPTVLSHESLHDLNFGSFPADLANACEIRNTGLDS